MTEPDFYLPEDAPNLEFVYNNESELAETYWPLFNSSFKINKQANSLYNDSPEEYFTYSGLSWNTLMVSKQKDGRYKNFTLRAVEDDSFTFYFGLGLLTDGVETYYSGPLTTSGSYSVLTVYSGEQLAKDNAVHFTYPESMSIVYTLPDVTVMNFVKLYHKAISGEPYRLYQFLPRTLIQVDDLEAEVIDAVTVRVSDSLIIGPDMIPDKSLLGSKIVDGTVSGILLTDGTITGNKIVAATISGVLITAGTLTADKIASKSLTASQIQDASLTGALIQAGTVSGVLIADNAISASKIQANTITGNKIVAGTISGSLITAGAITSDKISVTNLQAVSASTGSLSVNGTLSVSTGGQLTAGIAKINNTGIQIGSIGQALLQTNALRMYGSTSVGNVVGLAMFNGSFSSVTPQFQLNIDSVNAIEFENNVLTNPSTHFNFPDTATSASFRIYNAGFDLRKTSTASDQTAPSIFGYTGANELRYSINNNQFLATSVNAGAPSYSFIANSNTGMFNPAADFLSFTTAGSQRLNIDSIGRVGINTTSIGAFRALAIRDAASTTYTYMAFHEGATQRYTIGTQDGVFGLVDDVAGLFRIRVDNLGRTGINRFVPLATLDVGGDINFEYGGTLWISRGLGPTSEGGNNTWPTGTSRLIYAGWNGAYDTVQIYTPGSASATPKFRLTADSRSNLGDNAVWESLATLDLRQTNVGIAIPPLSITQAALGTEMIRFRTTIGAGNPVQTSAVGTYWGKVRVNINGNNERWIALYN